MVGGKRALLVAAVAAAMALAIAAPAFAGGYLDWNAVSSLNPAGASPHGAYATATVKCQVCHAIHYANATGQVLLNSSVSGACNYCHLNTTTGYLQVYGSNPNFYNSVDVPTAHNGVVGGVMCTDCHQVHAAASAMTSNAALTSYMLKAVPTTDPAGKPLSGEETYTAMSKWCSNCHYTKAVNGAATSGAVTGVNQYLNTGFNGPSHIMTSTVASYVNTAAALTVQGSQVAWQSSAKCMFCHSAGTWKTYFGNPNNFNSYTQANSLYDFPHYTVGAANFLESSLASGSARSGATTQGADGVCLTCHAFRNSGSTIGVGMTF